MVGLEVEVTEAAEVEVVEEDILGVDVEVDCIEVEEDMFVVDLKVDCIEVEEVAVILVEVDGWDHPGRVTVFFKS